MGINTTKRIVQTIAFVMPFLGLHSCTEDNPPSLSGLPFNYFFLKHVFVDPGIYNPGNFQSGYLSFMTRAQDGSTAPVADDYYYDASASGNEELPQGCSKIYIKNKDYRTIKIVGEMPRKGTVQPNELKWLEILRYEISIELGPSFTKKTAVIKFIDYDEEIDFTNNLDVSHGATPENANHLLVMVMNFSPMFRKDGAAIFFDLRFEELDY